MNDYAIRRVERKTHKIVFRTGYTFPTKRAALAWARMMSETMDMSKYRYELLKRTITVTEV